MAIKTSKKFRTSGFSSSMLFQFIVYSYIVLIQYPRKLSSFVQSLYRMDFIFRRENEQITKIQSIVCDL